MYIVNMIMHIMNIVIGVLWASYINAHIMHSITQNANFAYYHVMLMIIGIL